MAKYLSASLVVLTLAGLGTPVLGADELAPYPTAWAVVSYADLDVGKRAGAEALLARIEATAERVCGSRPHVLELKEQAAYIACADQSVDRAVFEADLPVLAAVYAERGGRIGTVTIEEPAY